MFKDVIKNMEVYSYKNEHKYINVILKKSLNNFSKIMQKYFYPYIPSNILKIKIGSVYY